AIVILPPDIGGGPGLVPAVSDLGECGEDDRPLCVHWPVAISLWFAGYLSRLLRELRVHRWRQVAAVQALEGRGDWIPSGSGNTRLGKQRLSRTTKGVQWRMRNHSKASASWRLLCGRSCRRLVRCWLNGAPR